MTALLDVAFSHDARTAPRLVSDLSQQLAMAFARTLTHACVAFVDYSIRVCRDDGDQAEDERRRA
jgi:hypothetical protein